MVLDEKGGAAALVVGIVLGAIGIALLASRAKPKCPACKNVVEKGEPACVSCGAWLAWK